MKIILTGSLGHIGKPLAIELVQKGHDVTVISSNNQKIADIDAIGAKPAIGTLEDVAFLTRTFAGADVVYTMVPPNDYFDHGLDLLAYYRRLGEHYATAVKGSGVRRVVNLSSIGAHLDKGNGILAGAHDLARILDGLPSDVSITHMRPTSFFYNLNAYIHSIKTEGVIFSNHGETVIPWVAPVDIASAVADEITSDFTGRKIRYVASEELTGEETARILGQVIGKPDFKWVMISDAAMLDGLLKAGMNPKIASGLVEMYSSLNTGLLSEDYFRNRPVLGKTKLVDYAKEFTAFIR